MSANQRSRRNFYLIFGVLLSLHMILILSLRIIPFIDLPNHLAAATILKHFDDGTNYFPTYYSISTSLNPNVFHLYFCSLGVFPSVEIANKIYCILLVLLLPISVLLLIKKVGGNEWFAILSIPFVYNYNVSWGFMGFAFGVPLIMLLAFLLVGYPGRRPVLKRTAIVLILLLLFFVHALAALFSLLLFFSFLVYRFRNSALAMLRESLVAVPTLICIAVWWWSIPASGESGLLGFLVKYYGSEFIQTFHRRSALFVYDNYSLFAGWRGYAAGLLFSVAVLLPSAYLILIRRRAAIMNAGRTGAYVVHLHLLCAAFCYFALPRGLPYQYYLHQRFAVVLILSVLITGSTLVITRLKLTWRFAIVAIALIHLTMYTDYFREFQEENSSFTDEIFDDLNLEDRLVGLMYDFNYRGREIYLHFSNYYIIWKKGIASTSITEYRFGTVRRAVPPEIMAPYEEYISSREPPEEFYRNMDYYLVRGERSPSSESLFHQFRRLTVSDKWSLYKKESSLGF